MQTMQTIEKDKIYNIDCLEYLNSIKSSGGGVAGALMQ